MATPVEKTNIVTAIVYDFETGGLDCTRCAATQISLHAVRLDTFEVMDKMNLYILPYKKQKNAGKPPKKVLKDKYEGEEEEDELMDYEQRALDISGVTMDMLHSLGRPLADVCDAICDFIERNTFKVTAANKPFMIGQNPLFDKGFMQQIMIYTDRWARYCKAVRGSKDFWGNFQPAQLDTIILSQLTFDDDPSVTNWKLESMSEKFGIDLDDAHDADADVTATREIVRTLTERMRNTSGSNAVGSLLHEKKEKTRDHFKI